MTPASVKQKASWSNASTKTSPSAGPAAGVSIAPPNRTGLPDVLKSGVESLSGFSLNDVRVHPNSSKPAQLQALAYTQGTDIHVAPGQERHLPHEAWHVVQQKQGRVKPTRQFKSTPINDDFGLEKEADTAGKQAQKGYFANQSLEKNQQSQNFPLQMPIQRKLATLDDINPQNLSAHYTNIVGNQAEGRGAQTSTGKALKTKIKWDAIDPDTGEGTGVEANPLGPDHPLGSATSTGGISDRTQNFNLAFAGAWKQGHLLNANLGGPGDEARNLVSISGSTNSSMSSNFENALQSAINTNGQWMHYKIEAEHAEIENSESKSAAASNGLGDPAYWAKTLKVSWGLLDDDGNKTGNTTNLTLTTGEPVTRGYIVPKTKKTKPVATATGNLNIGTMTTIGDEDIILDSDAGVASQFDRKVRGRAEKYDDELRSELEYPASPFSMDTEVDDELTTTYPSHQPLKTFSGQSRGLQYYNSNRKLRETHPYYIRDFSTSIKKAKLKPEKQYPLLLGTLFTENIANEKITQALEEAALKYPELGEAVSKTKYLWPHLRPIDYKRLTLDQFYEQNPKAFQNYYDVIKKSV